MRGLLKENSPSRLRKEYDKYNGKGKEGLRRRMLKRAFWSDSTFHRKINDPDSLSPMEKDELSKVFARRKAVLFPKPKVAA